MTEAARLQKLLRGLAIGCLVLLLAISTLSAFLRLTRAGLGCDDWPQCYGQTLAAQQRGEGDTFVEQPLVLAARFAHRIAASAALLVIVLMLWIASSIRPRVRRAVVLAALLLVLAVMLAVLGRWSGAARVPAVAIGNLAGGLLMIALCWQLARAPGGADPIRRATALRVAFGAAACMLLLQIASGAMVSAGYGGRACPDLWTCDAHGLSWRALDPFVAPRLSGAGFGNPDGAVLQQVHRLGAVAVALLLAPLALAAWRLGARLEALLVLGLLVAQGALGASLVAFGLPLPLALIHSLVSGVLLAACLDLALARPP